MSLVKRRWLLAAGILVLLGIGNYLIYTRLLQPRTAGVPGWTAYLTGKVMVMQGESMLPTYREGDRISFRTYRPEGGGPQRGEVILYTEPANQGQLNVKRVIGIGGDRVSVSKGTVYLNGKPRRTSVALR